MCNMTGYDVISGYDQMSDSITVNIDPHFCRIEGDCGGGFDFEGALKFECQLFEVDNNIEMVKKLKNIKNYTEYKELKYK